MSETVADMRRTAQAIWPDHIKKAITVWADELEAAERLAAQLQAKLADTTARAEGAEVERDRLSSQSQEIKNIQEWGTGDQFAATSANVAGVERWRLTSRP